MTRKEYISKFYPIAVKYSRSITGGKLFPVTALTQAIAESSGKNNDGSWSPGQSYLARVYNNHFGIKADSSWKGKIIELSTPNDANKKSKFRAYDDPESSYKDYFSFVLKNPRYKDALQKKDYKSQLKAIAAAGYAESSKYGTFLAALSDSISTIVNTLPSTIKKWPFVAAVGALIGYGFYKKNHAVRN